MTITREETEKAAPAKVTTEIARAHMVVEAEVMGAAAEEEEEVMAAVVGGAMAAVQEEVMVLQVEGVVMVVAAVATVEVQGVMAPQTMGAAEVGTALPTAHTVVVTAAVVTVRKVQMTV
jgi:hypothetical protein